MRYIKSINEALIRKKTLNQLKKIHDLMPNDIGEYTSKDIPEHIDREHDQDLENELAYDKSNEIIGTYGMGNFGENFGDITNNGNYANILSIHNPLDNKTFLQPYEDMHHLYWFGDSWKFRDPKHVQKFDLPDKDLLEKIKIKRLKDI